MATELEDLKVLHRAEQVADAIWAEVSRWEPFTRDVVGKQLARAADSIGANIAEAYGRFHYGEKIRFLYYARGSLFETKYWLNRARLRQLLAGKKISAFAKDLGVVAQQINAFVRSLKEQRGRDQGIKEPATEYLSASVIPDFLFSEAEVEELSSVSSP